MNIRVVYYSGHKGNTMKVAEAIAETLNIKAERIGKEKIEFSEPVDLLFVGSGIYSHKPHKKTRAMIKKINPAVVKNAAAFGTYGNHSDIGEQIKKLLQEQGINVLGEPFVCKGASIGTDNKGHPNTADLENAKAFANKILSMVKGI
jgi:flavodoxin